VEPSTPPTSPRVSVLAIASLVLGFFLCVPVVPQVAAIVLGAMALSRIRAADGRLGGRRLAIAGLVLGGSGLVLQAYATEWIASTVRDRFDRDLREGIAEILAAVAADGDGGTPRGLARLAPDAPLSAADLVAFATDARTRYGEPDGLSVLSQVPTGTAWSQEVTAALVFGFRRDGRREERTGSAVAAVVTPLGSFLPRLRIREVRIEDRIDGDLVLGTAATAEPDSGENAETPDGPEP